MTRTKTWLTGCLWAAALFACDSSSTQDMAAEQEAQEAQHSTDETSAAPEASQEDADESASKSGEDEATSDDADAEGGEAAASAQNTDTDNATSQSAEKAVDAVDHHKDIRGLCDLSTNFPDDAACIPAPPEGEGMQIHMGPTDYDDAEQVAEFILHPGEESSECFQVSTPNDEPIYYQTSMLSGRAGTHHIINRLFEGGEMILKPGPCDADAESRTAIGPAPGASKPFMPRGTIAPEYEDVGRSIPAHAVLHADMHYYNFTDEDLLREFWLNIYYVDKEQVRREASQIALLGGLGWNEEPIEPKTDHVYAYSCPVKGEGEILSLLGHYHAHGKRFTATITRATGETEKVFEMYDYMDPAQFEYNSIIDNPPFSEQSAGAVTGRLPIHDGDIMNWECHIVNDSDVPLRYVNEVKTGEMCNLWGQSIGVEPISCYVRFPD